MPVISEKRTHHSIRFGTDGWRALIAQEFTYDNLHLATAAIARYINTKYSKGTPAVIGYDPRFLADRFASFSAKVLNSYGIPVKLSKNAIPTPVMAHAAREENSSGALIFTASHNPPEYMGLKYFPDYAGPATVDITNKILEFIDEIALRVHNSKDETLEAVIGHDAKESSQFAESTSDFDPKPAYIRDIRKVIDFNLLRETNSKKQLTVAYDPIYGAGRGYADELLKEAGFKVITLHDHRDPLFGGGMPEPKEEFLGELKETVKSENAIFGGANDGDADRFAIIGNDGNFYPANKVCPIILKYLAESKKYKGLVARTVCTTHLLDRVAAKFNLDTVETPVGFKWLGEVMREQDTVIAAEESGGMSVLGHIPEKDGILAILLVAEVIAATGKNLAQLWEEVQDFVDRKYFYDRLDLHMESNEAKEKFVKGFEKDTPKEIAGFKVEKTDTTEGIKIYLENGSWLLARPSGTEAMCRVYFEGNNEQELAAVVAAVKEIVDNQIN